MNQIIEDLKRIKKFVGDIGKERINSMDQPVKLEVMIETLKPYAEVERQIEKSISKLAKAHTIPKSSTLNNLT